VGRRAPAHAAKAAASSQATPTTGWSGASKPGVRQNGGGVAPVASSHAAHSAFVTGVVAMAKASTHTGWAGRSPGCPSLHPIVNEPAATSTKSTRI
jgi:hypothetical protein